jgi:hypothetical protein
MSVTKRIIDLLRYHKTMSTRAVADRTGIDSKAIACAMKELTRARRVHISGWEGFGRAIYGLGAGVDVPRPAPKNPGIPSYKPRPVESLHDLLGLYGLLPIKHEARGRVHRMGDDA